MLDTLDAGWGPAVPITDYVRTYAVVAALAPLLVVQGRRVRARTPVLPEAAGPRRGAVGNGPPLRLAVVGESTAAGVGVTDQRDGLAAQLARVLAQGVAVEWHVVARTGSTVVAVQRDLAPLVPEDLDLVVVVLGVNDTLRLRPPASWRAEMGRLVDSVLPRLQPSGRLALVGVPDFGAIPALPRPLRTVLQRHARLLDGQLEMLASGTPRVVHLPSPPIPSTGAFCFDRFHPNADTYAAWARDIATRLSIDTTQHERKRD